MSPIKTLEINFIPHKTQWWNSCSPMLLCIQNSYQDFFFCFVSPQWSICKGKKQPSKWEKVGPFCLHSLIVSPLSCAKPLFWHKIMNMLNPCQCPLSKSCNCIPAKPQNYTRRNIHVRKVLTFSWSVCNFLKDIIDFILVNLMESKRSHLHYKTQDLLVKMAKYCHQYLL